MQLVQSGPCCERSSQLKQSKVKKPKLPPNSPLSTPLNSRLNLKIYLQRFLGRHGTGPRTPVTIPMMERGSARSGAPGGVAAAAAPRCGVVAEMSAG